LRAFFRFLLGLGMLSIHGSTFAPAFFITFAILRRRTVSHKKAEIAMRRTHVRTYGPSSSVK
jgi:hypothetical protein